MLVRNLEVVPSPLGAGRVRLRCEVLCDAAGVAPENYWLDMPPSHAQDLTPSAVPVLGRIGRALEWRLRALVIA